MFSLSMIVLVFLGAIFVIFSDYFQEQIKKIFAIQGVALVLPLLLMTLLVVDVEPYLLIVLLYIKLGLTEAISFLCKTIPLKACNFFLMPATLILTLTLSPVLIIKKLKARKLIIPFDYGGIVALMLWLFFIILYAVSIHD